MASAEKIPETDAARQAPDILPLVREGRKREQFIPLRKSELVAALCQELSPAEEDEFRRLSELLQATLHYDYHAHLEELKDAYAPFDPDCDTRTLNRLPPNEHQATLDTLFEKFAWLLERANFQRLSHERILEAVGVQSDWGVKLDVSFDVFERLEVYARGDTIGRRSRRRWRNRLRLEEVELPIYQRFVVMFRLRPHRRLGRNADTHTVYIKLFKDIPHLDIEMLLPGTQVKMSLLDQAKIILPTISGVGMTLFKLIKGALVVAAAGVYGMLAFLGILGGTIGYGIRSYFGYVNTRTKYQLSLTESLYYQNLANNAGVLFRLLDEAEEQEAREALLAYFFLWKHGGENGWTARHLDGEIERFLHVQTGLHVDFEVCDAVAKLVRWNLIERRPDDRLRAVPIAAALSSLDQSWDNLFSYSSRATAATIRAVN